MAASHHYADRLNYSPKIYRNDARQCSLFIEVEDLQETKAF